MTPEEVPEAINDLSKTVAALITSLSDQMIEVQAMVNVLVDLERTRLVKDGRSREAIAQFVQASFEVNRNSASKAAYERFVRAGLDVDLGPLQ
jgi:hypothetical protein